MAMAQKRLNGYLVVSSVTLHLLIACIVFQFGSPRPGQRWCPLVTWRGRWVQSISAGWELRHWGM